jgi:hypothetical protein
MSHEFMDAQIFSPWCMTPRSLLAADLGVYIKKEKKGLLWHLIPSYRDLLSSGDPPLVLSTAATIRSSVHDVLRWAM